MHLPDTVATFLTNAITVGNQPQNAPRRRASTAHDSSIRRAKEADTLPLGRKIRRASKTMHSSVATLMFSRELDVKVAT